MPWPFTLGIGRKPFAMIPLSTIMRNGISITGMPLAQFIKKDPRPLPRTTEPMDLDTHVRLICPSGGIVLFSGAQMHSSVPNTSGYTRFSIDFRTVHLDDVMAFLGAPNIDAACTGTTMNDYLRGNDLEHVPQEIVTRYRERAQQTDSLPGSSR